MVGKWSWNFFGLFPKSYCWKCSRPIFNINTKFGEMGLCVYCYDAYKMGRESILNKYPELIQIQCQKCGGVMTMRDKIENIFKTNKIALCCNHPDYSYGVKVFSIKECAWR